MQEIQSLIGSIQPMKRGRKNSQKRENLLNRCRKYKTQLPSFLQDFSIPSSNNQAEQDIRMAKLQQKISGTFRSEERAASFCRSGGISQQLRKMIGRSLDSLVCAFDILHHFDNFLLQLLRKLPVDEELDDHPTDGRENSNGCQE